MNRKLLGAIGVIGFLVSFGSPMLFILPLVIAVCLAKERIASLAERVSLGAAFILLGTVFGLLIELFAVVNNLHKPLSERVLMSPYPLTDLFYGIFYYGLIVSVWYLLLKRYSFSKKEVFFITGIVLGVGTEQMGQVFLAAISSVVGFLIACLVVIVYGTFPTLVYMVTEERFSLERKIPGLQAYILVIGCLIVQWAFFGAILLPLLKML